MTKPKTTATLPAELQEAARKTYWDALDKFISELDAKLDSCTGSSIERFYCMAITERKWIDSAARADKKNDTVAMAYGYVRATQRLLRPSSGSDGKTRVAYQKALGEANKTTARAELLSRLKSANKIHNQLIDAYKVEVNASLRRRDENRIRELLEQHNSEFSELRDFALVAKEHRGRKTNPGNARAKSKIKPLMKTDEVQDIVERETGSRPSSANARQIKSRAKRKK